jgi:predicted transcriptional regulator
MKYRGRDQIVASMLQSVIENKGIRSTKIMYNCFLSYPQLVYYLNYLTDKALLTYDRLNHGYNITARGLKFIELENKMSNLFKLKA